ncbi:MAG: metal-dependent hydrolase [Bernardetiaceae bacterium]
MQITFYGHSTLGIQTGQHHLLVDPFITPNELAAHIDANQIPADYILLTHGHQDHVADAIPMAKRTGATIVGAFEVATWAGTQGIEKTHPMNHGGSWNFDFGTLKMTNAVHSSVLPDGTYGGNPAGYLLQADKNIYIAGDTALTMDMQLIPRWAKLDLAILPIGDNFTMGIADAIIAAQFVQAKRVLGVHYDTFGYIKIDHAAAKAQFAQAGITLELLEIGASLTL